MRFFCVLKPYKYSLFALQSLRYSLTSILRELNRKIFPILTASQISEDFYADFLEDDLGFAILAYYGDMLVSQATS